MGKSKQDLERMAQTLTDLHALWAAWPRIRVSHAEPGIEVRNSRLYGKDGVLYIQNANGDPVQISTKSEWSLDARKDHFHTSSFEMTDKTALYIKPQHEELAPVDDESEYMFALEGEFQGVRFFVADINIMGGESPIERVVDQVLGLKDGEQVISILVQKEDGSVEVRPCRVG